MNSSCNDPTLEIILASCLRTLASVAMNGDDNDINKTKIMKIKGTVFPKKKNFVLHLRNRQIYIYIYILVTALLHLLTVSWTPPLFYFLFWKTHHRY